MTLYIILITIPFGVKVPDKELGIWLGDSLEMAFVLNHSLLKEYKKDNKLFSCLTTTNT